MSTPGSRPQTRHWIIYATILGMLLLAWLWRRPLLDLVEIVGDQDAVIAYLAAYGPGAPGILFLLLFLQVFLAPIPGHAFMVAGGYVYGFWPSTLLTLASTVLATQIAFLLTRRYGLPIVQRIASEEFIEKWNRVAGNRGGVFFFFAFILPIFPSDFMCFVAGLGTIGKRDFFLANFLGRFFIAAVLTSIGSHGTEQPVLLFSSLIVLYALLFLTWKPISRWLAAQASSFSDSRMARCVESCVVTRRKR